MQKTSGLPGETVVKVEFIERYLKKYDFFVFFVERRLI